MNEMKQPVQVPNTIPPCPGHGRIEQTDSTRTQQIEAIDAAIAGFIQQIERHPATRRTLGRETLQDFALAQHADNVRWMALIATMRDRCSNPALRKALHANMMTETGGSTGQAHQTLCLAFAKSLGIEPGLGFSEAVPHLARHWGLIVDSMTSAHMKEGEFCGWFVVAERLVPPLFAKMREQIVLQFGAGADLRYLEAHIDGDVVHADTMRQAAIDVLDDEPDRFEDILAGVELGGRATLSVLDAMNAVDALRSHAVAA